MPHNAISEHMKIAVLCVDEYKDKDSLFICFRVHPTPLEIIWFMTRNSPQDTFHLILPR